MKKTVKNVRFHSAVLSKKKGKKNIPKEFRYRINYARRVVCTRLEAGDVVRQSYRNFLFYMEAFSFRLDHELEFSFDVEKPSAFLCFMPEGSIQFFLPGGKAMPAIYEDHCYASFNKAGTYTCKLGQGWHHFVYISVRKAWLKRQQNEYSLLPEVLRWMKEGCQPVRHLPPVRTDAAMKRKIVHLFFEMKKPRNIEAWFFGLITALLRRYHRLALCRYEEPVYRIRKFIEEKYTDHNLTKVAALASHFGMYPKKLERDFRKEFLLLPGEYIHQLRMEHARTLLSQGQSVGVVSEVLGYKSMSNFSRAFRWYHGYPPGDVVSSADP